MNYVQMKRQLADALGIDQEDCRANDMTDMWCVRTGPDRELCVIAPDVESAADALRDAMQKNA